MVKFHESVLREEAVGFLNIREAKKYIDATVGGGGHGREILKRKGKLLGIDWDPESLEFSKKRLVSACPPSASCWKLIKGNFARLKEIAEAAGFSRVAGILFDLGLSLYQLKNSGKGFSFDEDSFLDMRADPDLRVTAYDLINGLNQKELTWLFKRFGEERWSARIARAIVSQRRKASLETTRQLADLILKTVPSRRNFRRHPATRCFQALRIAVGSELENLEKALPQAVALLEKGGRLVVISFHSLEDRIVKNLIADQEQKGFLVNLTKKPVRPTELEIRRNPRSRSAKLRAAERI